MTKKLKLGQAVQKRIGFTIVELLIVIVVIAILAAISIVAYNGVQGRAKDSQRMNDMASIQKALELYKIDNGNYPAVNISGSGAHEGWETSSMEAPGQFIAPLRNYGFPNGVSVDPVNDVTGTNNVNLSRAEGKTAYYYYRYPPGNSGCSASRGDFYILGILNTAQPTDKPGIPDCPGAPWEDYFSWYVGKYVN